MSREYRFWYNCKAWYIHKWQTLSITTFKLYILKQTKRWAVESATSLSTWIFLLKKYTQKTYSDLKSNVITFHYFFFSKNIVIYIFFLIKSFNQCPLKSHYFVIVILSLNTIYLSSSQDCHLFILIFGAHLSTIHIDKFFIKNIIFF